METVTTYQAVPPLPITTPFCSDLAPTQYLMTGLAYISGLAERPVPDFTREVAALEEVITYPEAVQQARYDHHRAQLLSGTPLDAATPNELRLDALALFGLAKDRQVNGDWALEPDVWLGAAHEALRLYRVDHSPLVAA